MTIKEKVPDVVKEYLKLREKNNEKNGKGKKRAIFRKNVHRSVILCTECEHFGLACSAGYFHDYKSCSGFIPEHGEMREFYEYLKKVKKPYLIYLKLMILKNKLPETYIESPADYPDFPDVLKNECYLTCSDCKWWMTARKKHFPCKEMEVIDHNENLCGQFVLGNALGRLKRLAVDFIMGRKKDGEEMLLRMVERCLKLKIEKLSVEQPKMVQYTFKSPNHVPYKKTDLQEVKELIDSFNFRLEFQSVSRLSELHLISVQYSTKAKFSKRNNASIIHYKLKRHGYNLIGITYLKSDKTITFFVFPSYYKIKFAVLALAVMEDSEQIQESYKQYTPNHIEIRGTNISGIVSMNNIQEKQWLEGMQWEHPVKPPGY